MKLAFAAVRDNELLMKEIVVKDLMKFFRECCSCESQSCKFCKALVTKFTNLSSKMKLSYNSKTDEWSLTLAGFRGKIDNNRIVASFYIDGGKIENKVAPYTTFKLVVGSEIEFRPPPQYRYQKFVRNLKFRVVVADADADGVEAADADEEEEEEKQQQQEEEKENVLLVQERPNLAKKSGQVVYIVDGEDKDQQEDESVTVIPSFEEIRSVMGFSPINITTDPVPHDEDLLSWSLHNSPRTSRRSIYDPIQINNS